METWPSLHWSDWADTCQTLHLWTQVAGKVRLTKATPVNHWWHVPLYVTTCGIGTSPIPDGVRTFAIDFDFLDHRLRVTCSDGMEESFALEPMSVARFYRRVLEALDRIGVDVNVNPRPSEIENAIPFDQDEEHKSYDPAAANRFWRALVQADRVFNKFRSRFIGKVSPVHFFWGSFDLAVTRFSGRKAPAHPGSPIMPQSVTLEAYSHEVSSAGFWPGAPLMDATFYAYAYPAPEGFETATIGPAQASWNAAFGEFVLPYEAVRTSASPDDTLMEFLQTTYEAAANLASWDRKALER
jgi:hypothetical protein